MSSVPAQLPFDSARLADWLLAPRPAGSQDNLRRGYTLLAGGMGLGKTTLTALLADELVARGHEVHCLSADPGSPGFGVPGAVSLGRRQLGAWMLIEDEPLCSLDAVRFRLPLCQAVSRLVATDDAALMLVDAPGTTRGSVALETLAGLIQASGVQRVLLLHPGDEQAPPLDFAGQLQAMGVSTALVPAAKQAARPSAARRARQRTALWDAALRAGKKQWIDPRQLALLGLIGAGQPAAETLLVNSDSSQAWLGRQVALLYEDGGRRLGEVCAVGDEGLELRLLAPAGSADGVEPMARAHGLLVRDAGRDAAGLLVTLAQNPNQNPTRMPTMRSGTGRGAVTTTGGNAVPQTVSTRVGPLAVRMVNGVFGDALLEVAVRGRRRRMLFDLGDVSTLSRRELNAVGEVFISHAHLDHVCGLLGLLRARIGAALEPCRIFGPPGIATHVRHCFDAICWDRIEDDGPVFEVGEIETDRIRWWHIQPGQPVRRLADQRLQADTVLVEDDLRIGVMRLDHGMPVLGFVVDIAGRYNVCEQALAASGWTPGPWLGELKRLHDAGETGAELCLPDGRRCTVETVARRLLARTPGTRLVFATDLADSEPTRETLIARAREADLLVCEAAFRVADAQQARDTGHLTTRACAEIAVQARVRRLLPFHFSKRYTRSLDQTYAELAAGCAGVPLVTANGRPDAPDPRDE
ncbi:MAG: hypothetical protein KDK91_28780 [Gammaproteobacteria bacterium]|nr:hypothetical protein [Gammaproteobacteria bacterium]